MLAGGSSYLAISGAEPLRPREACRFPEEFLGLGFPERNRSGLVEAVLALTHTAEKSEDFRSGTAPASLKLI